MLDPERLFSDVGYLMDIAIGEEDASGKNRWRLLLLEDCDELIRGEAKHTAGQALSRLLNLTDGLLGQGRNVLVGSPPTRTWSACTRPWCVRAAAWPGSRWAR